MRDAIEKAEENLAEKHRSSTAAERDLRQLQASINTNEQTRSDLIIRRTQLDIEAKVGYQAYMVKCFHWASNFCHFSLIVISVGMVLKSFAHGCGKLLIVCNNDSQ